MFVLVTNFCYALNRSNWCGQKSFMFYIYIHIYSNLSLIKNIMYIQFLFLFLFEMQVFYNRCLNN